MGQIERWTGILALLAERDRLTLQEIAEAFDTSDATARRDVDELARQDLLTRVRGGVVSNGLALDLPLRYKTAQHAPEKEMIAAAAARLVPLGSTVGLNGGTTTAAVARALASRSDVGEYASGCAITVVTNAVNIAYELATRPHMCTVLSGGRLRQQSYELTGVLAADGLERLALDFCFLSVDAVNAVEGAMAHHEGEAHVNGVMASRAETVVIVADGSKVGQRAFRRIVTVQNVDILITDASAPAGAVRAMKDAGCDVICA